MRADGRKPDELRPISIEVGHLSRPHGAALVRWGDTIVNCTAWVEESVPHFLRGSGRGWVVAEYSLLPGSGRTRVVRDVNRIRPSGRNTEIQRFIGRALRMSIELEKLGQRTIWVDCDVLQADGGTRVAAVVGGFAAMVAALRRLKEEGVYQEIPLKYLMGAVSCGMVDGVSMLDLNYDEDSVADVDMNVVMTEDGSIVEVLCSAERSVLSREQFQSLLDMAYGGVRVVCRRLREAFPDVDFDRLRAIHSETEVHLE